MNDVARKIQRKLLLLKMENTISMACYNDNIQNYGAWGIYEGLGRDIRYPITLQNTEGFTYKTKVVDIGVSLETLYRSYYKFGANELSIFQALESILTNLEQDYGLEIYKDFENDCPEQYEEIGEMLIYEGEVTRGAQGGGWNFVKPLTRDVYRAASGELCAVQNGKFVAICSAADMERISVASQMDDNIWVNFSPKRGREDKYYPFIDTGDPEDSAAMMMAVDETLGN